MTRFLFLKDDLTKEVQWVDLLDCDRPKKFWIEWSSAGITVGAGLPYQDQLIEFPDNDPYVPIDVAMDTADSYHVQYDFSTEEGMINIHKNIFKKH